MCNRGYAWLPPPPPLARPIQKYNMYYYIVCPFLTAAGVERTFRAPSTLFRYPTRGRGRRLRRIGGGGGGVGGGGGGKAGGRWWFITRHEHLGPGEKVCVHMHTVQGSRVCNE